MSGLRLREAAAQDAAAIAGLHVASWRATYRGIMADAYLDGPIVAERLGYWGRTLSRAEAGRLVLLLEDGQGLAGFIALGPDPSAIFDAHIDNLHVEAARRGQGLGRRLLGEAAGRLAAAGRRTVCLWVFDANEAALGFYAALGGIPDEQGTERIDGKDVPQTRIVWHDTSALAADCLAGA